MDGIKVRARHAAKLTLSPLLYRHPPIGLMPERLHVWTKALIDTKDVPGAVLEIGCAAAGTAVWSYRLLRNIGATKRYVCVDTFGGFSDDQFVVDTGLGTPRRARHLFSANSLTLARRVTVGLGAPEIELVQGDICTLPAGRLPERISACLIDVDLSEPIYAALQKTYPRLAPGGVIVVDDCAEDSSWMARVGYRRFVAEQGLDEHYAFGMGLVSA